MRLLVVTAGGVVLLDQLTKLLILATLPLYGGIEIIPGFFNIVHVRNTGAAFSILAGAPSVWRQWFFIIVTTGVLAILLLAYRKVSVKDRWTRSAYALIIGGALGNLVDRVRLGEVIDFLDVYWGSYHWPAFNVADSAITVGAALLILSLFRGR